MTTAPTTAPTPTAPTLTPEALAQVQQLLARRVELLEQYTLAVRHIDEQVTALLSPAPTEAVVNERTASEPEKTIAQERAEANARIALANKDKSASEKAEALDVPVATVRKVEKAKASAKALKGDVQKMSSEQLRKLAKELGVDCTGTNFRSSSDRQALRDKLESIRSGQAQAPKKEWTGLSKNRKAQLDKANAPTV